MKDNSAPLRQPKSQPPDPESSLIPEYQPTPTCLKDNSASPKSQPADPKTRLNPELTPSSLKDKSGPQRHPKSQPLDPQTNLIPSIPKEYIPPLRKSRSQSANLPDPNISTDDIPTMPNATHAVQPGLTPSSRPTLAPPSQINYPRDATDLPLASQHREPMDLPPPPTQPPHVTHPPSVCIPMMPESTQLAKGNFPNPLMSPAVFPPYFNIGHPEPS